MIIEEDCDSKRRRSTNVQIPGQLTTGIGCQLIVIVSKTGRARRTMSMRHSFASLIAPVRLSHLPSMYGYT